MNYVQNLKSKYYYNTILNILIQYYDCFICLFEVEQAHTDIRFRAEHNKQEQICFLNLFNVVKKTSKVIKSVFFSRY